jgi:uncharacterized metal-binding protein YceD (DUF177 family)
MYCCEKCGKKLIDRKENGVFEFKFGKKKGKHVVHIQIQGSIRMQCLRSSCKHINTFNFFPNVD